MVASVKLVDPVLKNGECLAVADALTKGDLTYRSPTHALFELKLTGFLGKPTLACSSGTAALHLALLALGIKEGDEVIVPDLTFGTAASVVMAVGAKPVLADVEPRTMCMTHLTVRDKMTKYTKAIIKTHLYGNECFLREYGVPIIEDSCEAFGIVPPSADYTCYSFFVNKPITTGEGGAICGNAIERARLWRDGSFDKDYEFKLAGLNYRMSAMQAAFGIAQLDNARNLIGAMTDNAERYAKKLRGTGRWMFCAESENPARLQEVLKEARIESRRVFKPLHLHPAFKREGEFPGAMEAWNKYLSLPTGAHLTDEQQRYVIEVVKNGSCDIYRSSKFDSGVSTPFGFDKRDS